MSKAVNIKVILQDGTEQVVQVRPGQPVQIKAVGKAKYQLIDAQTGQAPENFKAKRVGKNLLIKLQADEAGDADVVLEDFIEAEGAALVGQGGDGSFYEYVPQAAEAGAAALVEGQELTYALGADPIEASALLGAPLLVGPQVATVLGVGTGVGIAAGTQDDDAGPAADTTSTAAQSAVQAISRAAQANNAGPDTIDATVFARAGVTGVHEGNIGMLYSMLNSARIDGAAVDSAAKIQAMVDAMNAVLGGAGSGRSPTLAELTLMGIDGVTADNLAAVQAAIRRSADDGSQVDTMAELQALVTDAVNTLRSIAAVAEDNSATANLPNAGDYAKIGVTGVDAGNQASINSVLNNVAVNGAAVDTPAEIQALVNTMNAILGAADGQGGNAPQLTKEQYQALGLGGIDTAAKQNLLNLVIDGKTRDQVDSFGELQQLAEAVAAVMSAAAGGSGPTLEQLQNLGLTGITPANLAEVQKTIRATKDDGSEVDTLGKLQGLVAEAQKAVPPVPSTTVGLEAIKLAAKTDNATEAKPTVDDYTHADGPGKPGVTGVNADNLAAINSALNSTAVGEAQTSTVALVQALVNAYNKVLAAADGSSDKDPKPTQDDYRALGLSGVNTAPKESLLGEVIDAKKRSEVDSLPELQKLADAVSAVMVAAAGGTDPTLEQLQALGLTGLNPAQLAAVQAAIKTTPKDGSGVDSLGELQSLVDGVGTAFSNIINAAQANNATERRPGESDYVKAGVTGIGSDNLAAINSVLNTPTVLGMHVDTPAELQALVNTCQSLLNAADGQPGKPATLTAKQYEQLGVQGVDTPQKLALLNQLIGDKPRDAVDTAQELQALADAVAAVLAAAAGAGGPSIEQLQILGLGGVTPANLATLQKIIGETPDDGTGVDTLGELQGLLTRAQTQVPPTTATGLAAIIDAAQNNNALPGKPNLDDYKAANVSGVTAGNLAAINSVLNTTGVTGEKADSKEEVQALVDAYNKVLNAANGKNDDAPTPTQAEYERLGLTGVDTPLKAALLGQVIDTKTAAQVDSAAELQQLANAVNALLAAAAGGSGPSLEELTQLGLQGLNPANLAAVQQVITQTSDDGSGVNTLDKVQRLVDGVNQAYGAIRDAAQTNAATESSPGTMDYAKVGVSGVNEDNLAAVNSALNSARVDGAAVDTTPEIQAMVDAYRILLNAADGQGDGDPLPTREQYELLGISGINTAPRESLLGQVIDRASKTVVDTVPELQHMADAVSAVMAAAAGGSGPSLEQLQALGLSGLNPANLAAVQAAIRATADDGSQVDTVLKLQALVALGAGTVPAITATGLAAITQAAQDNKATDSKPAFSDYTAAGVTGLDPQHVSAINSALNTPNVTGERVNTREKVQALVNAYNKVLSAADGKDDDDAKPTLADYEALGLTGLDGSNGAAKQSLLGDVLDVKTATDVDTAAELQKLADAVAAVATAAAGGSGPTQAQLQALGLSGIHPANLSAIQQAIKTTPDDGSGVDSLGKLQNLVNGVNQALNAISNAAQANNATESFPAGADYTLAGVTGVDYSNLAAINSALNSASVDGQAVNTPAEIQALVSAYQAILNSAAHPELKDRLPAPSLGDYAQVGVSGVTQAAQKNLLGDVIATLPRTAVDSVGELQQLADAVAGITAAAKGTSGPSLEQLQALGVTGVTPANLSAVQAAIQATADDGSGVDSLTKLQGLVTQALVNAPKITSTGIDAIVQAAETNNASSGAAAKPDATDYLLARVSGVTADNLAAINSALNTDAVTGERVNTPEEIQALVDAYNKVLAAADGKDNNATQPTLAEYDKLGLTGLSGTSAAAKESLLGDVIDVKTTAEVDSLPELQKLADAVSAVIAAATGAGGPTQEQLQALGLTGINPANLAAVQQAIRNTADDGSGVDSLGEIQTLVNKVNQAFDAIRNAAQANNATESSPAEAAYVLAGVTGVNEGNLAAINSALNTPAVDGRAVDTAPEIQAVVDAYQAILAAADGQAGNGSAPSRTQYEALGISGVNTAPKESLLGQVIDAKAKAAVDTVTELQALADAVAAVIAAAAGGTGPSLEQLQALGIRNVTPANLAEVQKRIQATDDSGSGVDTVQKLNALVSAAQQAVPAVPNTITGLDAIKLAAKDNNATETKPSLDDYRNAGGTGQAGVTGVDEGNLAAINSALNTTGVGEAQTSTVPLVQALVDAYNKVLAAADGKDDNDAKLAKDDYRLLGVSGVETAQQAELLGDVIDVKAKADVDSAAELQKLADAVATVLAAAGKGPAPTLEQLQALGLTGLNPAKLAAVQQAIRNTSDDGTGVDSLPELQQLVNGVNAAFAAIADAAQANNATDARPSVDDYRTAGVSGVNGANLAAINSALNTASVNAGAVDTTPEIQALVDAYRAVLAAADGQAGNGSAPGRAQYELLGVTGVSTPQKESLLGQVIDAKPSSAVDSVAELQALADAVTAVMAAAAGGSGPSLEQLQALGISGVTPKNLATVQTLIKASPDDGSGVDTVAELQALVAQAQALVPPVTGSGLAAITQAAKDNNATDAKPNLDDYAQAGGSGQPGVSGVNAGNLAAINSALNTTAVGEAQTNTVPLVQALVDAYNKVLAAADGVDNDAAQPSPSDYGKLGLTGFESTLPAATLAATLAARAGLLGDVIDIKTKAEVDTVAELQKLADAVATVLAAAGTGTAPTLEQLQALGLAGVNPANLAAVQQAIKNTADDGSGVDTLDELQALVQGVNQALDHIREAAQANSATESRPSQDDYNKAGVSGVNKDNLAAINSALNTDAVTGAAVDTASEIQALVDAYKTILAAADGQGDNDPLPTPEQYAALGVAGVNTPQKQSLLGQVIDRSATRAVDTVPELQALADAVSAVMAAAAGAPNLPSLEQLKALGIDGVNPNNLAEVQKRIRDSADDGSQVDTLRELQQLVTAAQETVPPVPKTTIGLEAIKLAAKTDNATETKPTLDDYALAGGSGSPGVTGVNEGNLAAINSALNTAGVGEAQTSTVPLVQALVDAYNKVLGAADGVDNNPAKPGAGDYSALGLTGFESTVPAATVAARASLLGDVIDLKLKADVDTVPELQKLADAVASVLAAAGNGTAPSLAQLQALGLTGLNPANLAAVQQAIKNTADDGSGVDSLPELQQLIDGVNRASNPVSDALKLLRDTAQANNATETHPREADYTQAGVSGVDSRNLAAINSVLNTEAVDASDVASVAQIQALVDAYQPILAAADGQGGNTAVRPTAEQYASLGLTGVSSAPKTHLLGDVIDARPSAAVDTVAELQGLADAVAAVMAAASGSANLPSLDQLKALGITGVTPANLAAMQEAIRGTRDDGTEVDTVKKLQDLVVQAQLKVPTVSLTGLAAITEAAKNNNATESKPSLQDYRDANVTGVNEGNLAAINSALNTPAVGEAQTNTQPLVQAVVDAYNKVLGAADGVDNNAAKPSSEDYGKLGLVGFESAVPATALAARVSLLGDVIDVKAKADVDSAAELQKLADAVATVLAAAGNGPAPTLEQLQALGLAGLNPANLAAVQQAIRNTDDSGAGVDTLPELQALVDGVNQAFQAIRDAAQANKASESQPSANDYVTAGVTGVNEGNLAAINSALNTPRIDGGAVDTTPEIQGLVNAYQAVLAAADGADNNPAKPTLAQYEQLGLTGITSPQAESLLGDVLDIKVKTDVDSVPELQALADAVAAVMGSAAGASGPSLEQLQALGLQGVNPANLPAVQAAIRNSADDGSGVDTLSELQALVQAANTALDAIAAAAQTNNATASSPSLDTYRKAGVSGVDEGNLAAINSALNTPSVDAKSVGSTAEIQALVDAYNAVLAAADGNRDGDRKPTPAEYALLGLTGVSGALAGVKANLLGDVIDATPSTAVDTVPELQALADAVAAVMAAAAGGTGPSLEQLQALGVRNVTPANLAEVQKRIQATDDSGTGVDTVQKLNALVSAAQQVVPAVPNTVTGLDAIKLAAKDNNATETKPNLDDYRNAGGTGQAGVTGVDEGNLAAINSALNTTGVGEAQTSTVPLVQALVDAYNKVLAAADGQDNNPAKPSASEYKALGLTGFESTVPAATVDAKLSLLGDVVDIKARTEVDTVPELQKLADAVAAVIGSAGVPTATSPTLEQLQALGLSGVSPANLAAVQAAIKNTAVGGGAVDTLAELQALVNGIAPVPAVTLRNLDAIKAAAQDDKATEASPTATDYTNAGVSGITGGPNGDLLASINSVLNTGPVNETAVDSAPKIQAMVDAYNKVLAAADGRDNDAPKPTADDYAKLGITGVGTPSQAARLGDVIDIKVRTDVDRASELQALADAVATVIAAAAPNSADPSLAQLQALGLAGVNPANLAAVQKAIKNTADDGSGVDSLPELQALVGGVNTAFHAISDAAEANNATDARPSADDYVQAGVIGLDPANLAAINSALNSRPVDAAAVDTTPEIQALVDAYQSILAAADGNRDGDAKPSQAAYARVGVTGVNTPPKESLLGDVVDAKARSAVDSVPELQALADAVAAVMAAAAGATGVPSLEQLQALGVEGVTPANLAEVQKRIRDSADDGAQVDTVRELNDLVLAAQTVVPPVPATTTGLDAIKLAAKDNNATESKPKVDDYTNAAGAGKPGVTGVDEGNLAAINSALNTAGVGEAQTSTVPLVQALVDAYNKVLAAADGKDDNDAKPTQDEYRKLGLTGINSPQKESLLGDVLDIKARTEVDSLPELQALADAASAVIGAATPNAAGPSLEQLQALGISGVNPANLAAVQAAIKATAPDGSGVDTLPELQALVNGVHQSLNAIRDAAQANNATDKHPSLADYVNAGITGLEAADLPAINSALNTEAVTGEAVDSPAEIQALVDAYKLVLAAADGKRDGDRKPTASEYALLGVTGVLTAPQANLLGDVIDASPRSTVDTVPELQALANAVAAVMAAAAGATGVPSVEQLQALGVKDVNPANLAEVQKRIRDSADDGTQVDTVEELNNLVTAAKAVVPAVTGTGVAAIVDAAQRNNATSDKPALTDYTEINGKGQPGVTGVNADNLAAINSALNTDKVSGDKVDTLPEVQALVDAYNKVLAAADGTDNDAAKPSATDYNNLGLTGFEASVPAASLAAKLSLLGDVIDLKAKAEVDTVPELQALADAVAAVVAGAATGPAPTLEQLQLLGLQGVNPANLAAVQAAIRNTDDNGTGVDTLPELQALVGGVNNAFNAIREAAQANNATDNRPSLDDYRKAGVTGLEAADLPAINSALNTEAVTGEAVDSPAEIQALVDAYKLVLAAADGKRDGDRKPTASEFALLGVTGVLTAPQAHLLGDVIDAAPRSTVDTVPELQALANAVAAVMAAAAGATGVPSVEQLQALGVKDVNPANLAEVQKRIRDSADDGTQVDTVEELNNLVAAAKSAVPAVTGTGVAAIVDAAQRNNATSDKPALTDYTEINGKGQPGVTGVNADNLAAINSALNTDKVTGDKVDTLPEVQALVDAYNKVLAAADGTDNDAAKPSATDYNNLGLTGFEASVPAATLAAKLSLLGDVIDLKAKAEVDTVPELQALADAVAAVVAGAATGPAPTLEQLQLLGLKDINPANLAAVQAAIRNTDDNGTGVDTLPELQALVTGVNTAFNAIATAAENNSATPTTPGVDTYTLAGVTGVTAGSTGNLAAINDALNSRPVDGAAVDTTPEIQALVDAYKAILSSADGLNDGDRKPTQTEYARVGVTGVNTAQKESLLGDVIDRKTNVAVDTVGELQHLADVVAAVMSAAAGGSGPAASDFGDLGLTGVGNGNLADVLAAIAATQDGSKVDTLPELQALIDQVNAAAGSTYNPSNLPPAIRKISVIAENNSATASSPSLEDYVAAQVTGTESAPLRLALASALNSALVDGLATDSKEKIQEVVNAYTKILSDASGGDNVAVGAGPTQMQLSKVGVTGADTPNKVQLLGDVIDLKTIDDVDTVTELQGLADAVAAVMSNAQGQSTRPTELQLQALGLSGVTADNLAAIQARIQNSGSAAGDNVNTVPKLQALVSEVVRAGAVNKISQAAENNSAGSLATPLLQADYEQAKVSGVNAGNLGAINSALDTNAVTGALTDTTAKIQGVVDAYVAILATADELPGSNDASKAQFEAIGITGLTGTFADRRASLLADVVDRKAIVDVNTARKIQDLADKVAVVIAAASPGNPAPTEAQLKALGLTGISADNLASVQAAILNTDDNGTGVDTVKEIQDLIDALPAYTSGTSFISNRISRAAENNDATPTSPSVADYDELKVSAPAGQTLDSLLAPLASALNSGTVKGADADTQAEVQAIVDAYAKVLRDADGSDNVDLGAGPTADQFRKLGVTGLDGSHSAAKTQLLGDAIDTKTLADVATVPQLQVLAQAASAVIDYAASQGTGNAPTRAQLLSLGLSEVANLPAATLTALQTAIGQTGQAAPTGTAVDSLQELRGLLNTAVRNAAVDKISLAAKNNSAGSLTTPLLQADYEQAGVTGVNAGNLGAINSALDTQAITDAQTNSPEKVQAIVNAYAAILATADGQPSNNDASLAQLQAIGVSGLTGGAAAAQASLLADVIDRKTTADVDTVPKIEALRSTVAAVIAAATAGNPLPARTDLEKMGLTGLTDNNRADLVAAIAATSDEGTGVDTVEKIQALINALPTGSSGSASFIANPISNAAENNNASAAPSALVRPLATDYTGLGVTIPEAANAPLTWADLLPPLASVLNTGLVQGPQADTREKVQALVNTYAQILRAADQVDNTSPTGTGSAADPTQQQYALVGLTGVDSSVKANLLSDVIDSKTGRDVDSIAKIQVLADTAADITNYARTQGASTAPTFSQLQSLGLTGLNTTNSPTLLSAIAGTGASAAGTDGSLVDSVAEIQALLNTINRNLAIEKIKTAADNNSAKSEAGRIELGDYTAAGATATTLTNLPSYNDALNTTAVAGTNVDSTQKIQDLVNAYNAILTTANGAENTTLAKPTQAQYEAIGVTGLGGATSANRVRLLGDVIDIKNTTDVDTVKEIQDLLAAVNAVMAGINGATTQPTLEQLKSLGLTNLTASIFPAVQTSLAAKTNPDTVDTREELQALINTVIGSTLSDQTIPNAAQANNATDDSPTLADYANAGVTTGVNIDNLAAVNSALNAEDINDQATNTTTKIQAIVNAYNRVLTNANGVAGDQASTTNRLTQSDFNALYLPQINDSQRVSLMGDVIDRSTTDDVGNWSQLADIANSVNKVIAHAGGASIKPTSADFDQLQVEGVTNSNLAIVQKAVFDSANDGTEVDTVPELQRVIIGALAAANKATNTLRPADSLPVEAYEIGGATGADEDNVDYYNAALDSTTIGASNVNTAEKLSALVDGYNKVLAAADGNRNATVATTPSAENYRALAITGLEDGAALLDNRLALLNDAIDAKANADVNTLDKIQALANAAVAVMNYAAVTDPAAPGGVQAPSQDQLQLLGVTGVNAANLSALQTAIAASADSGVDANSLQDLHLRLISGAAESAGSAGGVARGAGTPANALPWAAYVAAGATSSAATSGTVNPNVGAYNDALDDPDVTGSQVGTLTGLQALIGSYDKILAAANGSAPNPTALNATASDYINLGVNGLESSAFSGTNAAALLTSKVGLINDVVQIKNTTAVDEIVELQAIAAAAQRILAFAARDNLPSPLPADAPTADDFTLLGAPGVTDGNRTTVLNRLVSKNNGGGETDSVSELRDLIPQATIPTVSSVRFSPFTSDGFTTRTSGNSSRVIDGGDTLAIEVEMSAAVTVTGTPTISFSLAGAGSGFNTTRTATYSASSSNSTKLVFIYQVQNSDFDIDGAAIPAGSISLPTGASIAAASDNTTLGQSSRTWDSTKAVGNDSNFRVDAIGLSGITGGTGTLIKGYKLGGNIYYFWDKNSDAIYDNNDNGTYNSANTLISNAASANLGFNLAIPSLTELRAIRDASASPSTTWGSGWSTGSTYPVWASDAGSGSDRQQYLYPQDGYVDSYGALKTDSTIQTIYKVIPV